MHIHFPKLEKVTIGSKQKLPKKQLNNDNADEETLTNDGGDCG
jgi:hypothetical protein